MPKYLSSDHDPLFRFDQWQANLRILEVSEIKTVPYVPLSHPFVERLIGTIRREYLDPTLFWTTADLENKLLDFQTYFNEHRAHAGRQGRTPEQDTRLRRPVADLHCYGWQRHCRDLHHTPNSCLTLQKLVLTVAPGGHWQANRRVPMKTLRYWHV
jgi:putative transposase